MNWAVNQLVEWLGENGDPLTERLLWMDLSYTDVYLFDVRDPKALPVWRRLKDLESAVSQGIARVLAEDPLLKGMRPDDLVTESQRVQRDQAWQIIQPLVEMADEAIYRPETRGPLIADISVRAGVTKTTIYGYLRRYWRGGQTKNALLPEYERRGGRGKTKRVSDRKRGRPPRRTDTVADEMGINVDEDIREKFRRGIRLFYETRKAHTLKEAYQLMLEHLFHQGYEKRGDILVPVLPAVTELPSFGQFRYWYEKERDWETSQKRRLGERRYALSRRPITGDSTQMAQGPGALYQIDATIADVYLVSRWDRNRVIGRPVVYMVEDVFSRMIVGLSVSLEGPSWLGAMLALENAASDKTGFCGQFGIEDVSWWPAQHLPDAILADRGELEGYNADQLVNALAIRVANTPPYRGDLKAIIEQNFRLMNLNLVGQLPGAVVKDRERGEPDYRLDAVLTLDEFTHLLVLSVRDHNLYQRLDSYPMTEDMMADNVEPYPWDLWQWGITHRSGHLRSVPHDVLRLNLLPGAEASVTPRGIQFRGVLYTTERAIREQWYERAQARGTFRVALAFDPRVMDVIYLRDDNGTGIEPGTLLDRNQQFRGYTWWDYEAWKQAQAERTVHRETRERQAQAELHAEMAKVVQQAQTDAENTRDGSSKRARVKSIRANRQIERDEDRGTQGWRLGQEEAKSPSSAQLSDEEGYVPPPDRITLLRRLKKPGEEPK